MDALLDPSCAHSESRRSLRRVRLALVRACELLDATQSRHEGGAGPEILDQTWLDAWLRSAAPLLRAAVRPSVRLEMTPAPHCRVAVSASDLSSMVFNLVTNASQAIVGHGQIHIAVAKRLCSGRIAIGVSDSGRGMSETVRRHALRPGYSTRPGGWGRGLDAVSRLVRKVRGDLSIESQLGAGTRIELRIPQAIA